MNYEINPKIEIKVKELMEEYPTVQHELIKRLGSVDFSADQIQAVSERFYHVIKNFPRFLAAIISNWDDTKGRMHLVENLFEEHGRMNEKEIHVNTYLDYLKQVGVDVEKVVSSNATPATLSYIRSVLDICRNHSALEGLGAIGIIEDIVHRVSSQIGDFTKKHKDDIENVSHFDEHKVLDDQHSKEIYSMILIDSLADEKAAFQGLTMGAFYHHQLYNSILQEVCGKEQREYSEAIHLSPEQKTYPLQTGDLGKKRLDILNGLYNPSSIEKLDSVLVGAKSFLEIGCGTGQISNEISENHPDISVLGTDISSAQISVSRKTFSRNNLSYVCKSVEEINESGQKFDVIYARWVLIYLADTEKMISLLKGCLSDNGVLVIEDNDPKDSAAYALSDHGIVEKWDRFWGRAITALGQAPEFEKKLIESANALGLTLFRRDTNQQTLMSKDEKQVFFLGIEESKDRILQNGFPKNKLDDFLGELFHLGSDPLPLGFVRNFILFFRK